MPSLRQQQLPFQPPAVSFKCGALGALATFFFRRRLQGGSSPVGGTRKGCALKWRLRVARSEKTKQKSVKAGDLDSAQRRQDKDQHTPPHPAPHHTPPHRTPLHHSITRTTHHAPRRHAPPHTPLTNHQTPHAEHHTPHTTLPTPHTNHQTPHTTTHYIPHTTPPCTARHVRRHLAVNVERFSAAHEGRCFARCCGGWWAENGTGRHFTRSDDSAAASGSSVISSQSPAGLSECHSAVSAMLGREGAVIGEWTHGALASSWGQP